MRIRREENRFNKFSFAFSSRLSIATQAEPFCSFACWTYANVIGRGRKRLRAAGESRSHNVSSQIAGV